MLILYNRQWLFSSRTALWFFFTCRIMDHTHRTCDSISFIDGGLRHSSTGCLSDSLCDAGRRAVSSPAYIKPLEVNFLIKAPHSPPPPLTHMQLCGCARWHLCVCVYVHVVSCLWGVTYLNLYTCMCSLCLHECIYIVSLYSMCVVGVFLLVCSVHVYIYVFHVFMKPNLRTF